MHAPGHDPSFGVPGGRKQSYRYGKKPEPAAQQPTKPCSNPEEVTPATGEDPPISGAREETPCTIPWSRFD